MELVFVSWRRGSSMAIAEYKYLFTDLLTGGSATLEVPMYGISFGREINKAGSGTGSINLDQSDYSNTDIIDATVPGKTGFYIDRNGGLIWGGILWSRTYQAQAKVFSYTMQSFESFSYKVVIEDTLEFVDRDQRNIVCELFMYMQQKLQTDIGIQIDPNYPFPEDDVSSTLRTVSFFDYDVWTFGKAIEYMVEFDQGLDYTIEVYYDEQGNPASRMRTDNILGAAIDNTGLVFEYPGNIINYYWPENASRGATSVIGVGAGDGIEKITSRISDPIALSAGYPDLQEIYSNTDVSVQSTLDSQTTREVGRLHIPITVPTIEIDANGIPSLDSFGMGDYAQFAVEDARFEAGMTSYVRVIGYQASPPSSDGVEQCTLILAGEDAGV